MTDDAQIILAKLEAVEARLMLALTPRQAAAPEFTNRLPAKVVAAIGRLSGPRVPRDVVRAMHATASQMVLDGAPEDQIVHALEGGESGAAVTAVIHEVSV